MVLMTSDSIRYRTRHGGTVLMTSDITRYRTRRGSIVLVDVLLFLHVSRTTRITVQ